jgi:hypothetical protein
MQKKVKFDQDAAFKSIIGVGAEDEEPQDGAPETAAEPQESSPVIIAANKKEARSQRVNLLIQPSVYTAAKKKCKRLNISLNECMNQFLEKWSADEN